MKNTILYTLFLLFAAGAFAQNSNIILFTEAGERFQVVLNGLQMNEEPVTNLKIEDLNALQYKLRIVFEDKNLGVLDKNLYLNAPGNETAFNIKQNKKGNFVLRFVSETPLAQAPATPANVQVIHYDPNPQPAQEVVVVEQTTTTTTVSDNNGGTTGDNVSMNVNVGGFGMDVNVTATDGSGTTSTGISSTTTTTTTTTSSSMSTGTTTVYEEPAREVVVVESGCMYEMAPNDYQDAVSSISSKSFADSKMKLAKQIVENNCVSSSQIAGMVKLFDFESDRLEFAKFGWGYTLDPNNYWKVNDAFEFESTIEELDEYIAGQR